ncbi:MAG: hypothetical protein ABIJ43_06000 [Candidatus Beckwithbacteria bacterium]|nr:LytR C-terminal domain-containing protein [Patescibacteria group bacterium]
MNRSKKKTSRWRREQLYLGIFFILLICFLVIFNFLWQRARASIWDGSSRIGIVTFEKEELDLTVMLPKQKKIVSFKLPFNTLVEAPFGFGEYQLGNIYNLGKLENEGGKLLMKTIQNNFGVFVSGFKVMGKSNLTWWDILRITWYESMVADKRKVVNLVNEQVLEEGNLADETKVLRIKTLLLDELINHELFDEKLLAEELEIAVLNASGGEGVAFNLSRLIRNIGGDVTVVSNLDVIEKSIIQINTEQNLKSYTVEVLASIFNIKKIELVENNQFRADVMVLIGKDYLSLR